MSTVSRLILSCVLVASSLLMANPASAQNGTREQVRSIEQEYSRQSGGRAIPDDQLEYYIDRARSGWSMNQISQDMANSRRQPPGDAWRPQAGWNASGIICSSDRNQYRECNVPFRGHAMLEQQISASACIEGRSWGQKQGLVWVDQGCRARFTMMANPGPMPGQAQQTVVCKSNDGGRTVCDTGMRGRVVLLRRFKRSAACIEGRTWGQRSGQVWVTGNCRARFAADGRPGPRDDDRSGNGNGGRGWMRDPNYQVSCAGNGNAQGRCSWDTRYGSPRVAERLSQTACVEGRSWGYTERDGLWVSGGCRARFVAR